jgi:hypothetical protein
MAIGYTDHDYCRLLELSPFERRRGGWRFGTKRISDAIVDRLVAGRRVFITGDQVHLVPDNDDGPAADLDQTLARLADTLQEA